MSIPISKEKNSHIAIWTNKYINFSHMPLNFEPILKSQIDWIESYKKEIDAFLYTMYDSLNRSKLNTKFLNAFIVANKGLYLETINEHNLALITYLSAAESLLAENQNEKSLRLSTLLPRLAHTDDKFLKKYCMLTKSLYSMRNNFMHSANEYKGQTLDEKDDINQLMILSQLVFKVILLNYDPTNSKSLSDFTKSLDNIFEDLLYSTKKPVKKV
jgi:hypothetical protein